ncbi:PiggyBac transposable element-derived protein 4, partial [Stegodyphus mimosarum]
MDNFFSSPDLFYELLHKYKIKRSGTIRSNRKNYLKLNAGIQMQKEQIKIKFSSGMTAASWKDNREVFMLSNMHSSIAAYDEMGKLEIVSTYNKNIGFVDLSDQMANSYTFGRKTLKRTKKIFFHLPDLAVLNSFILCKMKISDLSFADFRKNLIKQLLNDSEASASSARASDTISLIGHWPIQNKNPRRCVACQRSGIRKRSKYSCEKCDIGLCITCFKNFYESK